MRLFLSFALLAVGAGLCLLNGLAHAMTAGSASCLHFWLSGPPPLSSGVRREGAHMDLGLIILGVCEAAGLFFIWRLWRHTQKRSLAFRIGWSLLLLVPVVGIIFYGLVLNDPSEKPGWGDENNQGWGDDYTNYKP